MSELKAQLPPQDSESYLGDGLFVRFDGWQILLRAPRSDADHFVALEPVVFQNLLAWLKQFPRLAEHMGAR